MKVKQIVGEHKKGVRAHIYNKKATTKAQGPVPLYGPDKNDAKLKPVKMNEAPEDSAILAQVNALKQSNPQFAAELQSKKLSLVRGMGPDSQKHNAAIMQQYKMLVQKYSGNSVQEEMPGQMVGKVQQVRPDGTVDIQKPSGDTTTVQATALQAGDNNKLTMQTPKIQPGMQVDASKTIEENPEAQAQQYISQLTALMQQAAQPWEKKQIEYRIKAVQQGMVPQNKKVLPPAEWERTTDPTTIARIIGKDGLSPEYLEKSNMFGRGLDYIGLPGRHPTNPDLKFESSDLDVIKKLSGL